MSNLLNIGSSGLFASKKSLETTGHNLANANTEGYSRKKVNQTSSTPISKGGMIHGTGARVVSVTRFHDTHIEKRLNADIAKNQYFEERSLQFEQIESIFNEVNTEGLNQVLTKFYNSFRELANQPENETIRSVVRDNASLAVKDFNRIRESLNGISKNCDNKVERLVDGINQHIKHISDLNTEIARLENTGGETGDLRDQRDISVREISKCLNVTTYRDDKNNYVVYAENVGTLVTAGSHQELSTGKKSKNESSNNMANSIEIFFKNRPFIPITNKFSGGKISSLINVRNNDIVKLQKDIDNVAFDFANSVNAIHRRGFVNRQISTDAEGNPVTQDRHGPTTGINFFAVPVQRENASGEIKLSQQVRENISNIATALEANKPGDNRVALAISLLQKEKLLENGTTTLEEKYLQTVGNVGLETAKSNFDREQSEGILAQTQSIKERLVGVSIDEEAANMVKYQHAYQASAKVMQAADEMFKTVLAIKR